MDGRAPPATKRAPLVRTAREEDVDRLLEIHVGAFPDPRPLEVRRRVFLQNRLGGLEHLRVACAGEELVGHAFAFPIGVWCGGKIVRGRAVASVGVAIEARGQGVAGALLSAIHAEAAAAGDGVSLLYPFRQAFYARHGYAPVARQRVLTVSPRAIPRGWSDAAPGQIRRAAGDDVGEIARLYREAAGLGTGFLEREARAWEHDLVHERHHWLVLEHGGALYGYASVRLLQDEAHARVRADVQELVAPDPAARRRLFAAVAALADQVGDVSLAMAHDDPFDWAFVDGDRDRGGTKEVEHALGVVSTGPMIRLTDVAAALSARGYLEDGAVGLAVHAHPPCTLEVRGGVGRTRPGTSGVPVLELSTETLASIAFGGLRVSEAGQLGWLGASTRDAVREAALLEVPPFFSLDAF